MTVLDVSLIDESRSRYLTYALSVVNSRALPDVRDGLKPVQRRILYAMAKNLGLSPDKAHRKSAAVVGEVLARYHPHGDAACYEAMVRMSQDFNFRYPLIDGQGNFGSLDGDSAAAYRYTEARLMPLALEVVGDIGMDTVEERENFDQTQLEPVVLPSRVPQLLINGTTGIAVGMATAIPPHNLNEVVKALLLILEDPEVSETKILGCIKGPDFPTGCSILATKGELKQVYRDGRGPIKTRADYRLEKGARGKELIVINSIPYATDKSSLVEKIADLIIGKKVPNLNDVRDESTDVVRIVLETGGDADPVKIMAYLYKNTPLEQNFNVNFTALIPTDNPLSGKPVRLSLREMLEQFISFREDVTKRKLNWEKSKLEERIHLLEGLVFVFPDILKVIEIVRKSSGRSDAAEKLQKKFKLSELQAFFIVDMRIYQLSRTNIDEVEAELAEKSKRVKEINRILKSKKAVRKEISEELQQIAKTYGDARRSALVHDHEEEDFDADDYVQHEDAWVIVTKDGWVKRIRTNNDPETTRLRDGDSILFVTEASTKDSIAVFSNQGVYYTSKVLDLSSTSGYGDPIQKLFKFKDGEKITSVRLLPEGQAVEKELLLFSKRGLGFRVSGDTISETNRNGKRLMKLKAGDELAGVTEVDTKLLILVSEQGYGFSFAAEEVPVLSNAGKGVILQKMPDNDNLVLVKSVTKKESVELLLAKDKTKKIAVSEFKSSLRAKRGNKVVKRGMPVIGEIIEV